MSMPTIAAASFPYEFPAHGLALIITDMQRDFLKPGGFGEALGNNVALLAAIIPTARQLLDSFLALRRPIIHTKKPIALISRTAHRPNASVVSLRCVSATPVPWGASSLPVNRATTSCQLWHH